MRNSTKIYLILMGLSCLAFLIGLIEISSSWLMAVLFFSTFVKGKLIIDYFMRMHVYYARWTNFLTLWLGLIILLIVSIYFLEGIEF